MLKIVLMAKHLENPVSQITATGGRKRARKLLTQPCQVTAMPQIVVT